MRVNSRSISLKQVFLFKEVCEATLFEAENCCVHRTYSAGEEIIPYLDKSDEVFFVLLGKCRVNIYSASGKVVGFRDMLPGDIFGEYAALDGGSRSASVEAEEDSGVAIMSSIDFRRIVKVEATISAALISHLLAQVRALTVRVYEFSTLAVKNRIQADLLRLAHEGLAKQAQPTNVAHIEIAPTHAEMAARISTHREAVTRHLNELSRIGIIERRGRALFVNDVVRLERMVLEATGE